MAIRITGMYSGLDTESIINELASAQSYKKNKLVKAQTKLSWKQDAWKALNTKIYSFYQKLDDMRLQSSYLKKKTVVSNPDAVKVTGGKVDGTHTVSVKNLSKRATITSGSLVNDKGHHFTGSATLKQLGFSGSGSIRLSDNNGAHVDIDVNENMKIDDFVKALQNNTALTASYDQDQQRIYLSSWTSGKGGEFYLTGNDAGGLKALEALKLVSSDDLKTLTAPGGEYDVWSKYINADLTAASPSYSRTDYTADYVQLIKDEVEARMKAMKAQNDALKEENKDYDKTNEYNLKMLKEIQAKSGAGQTFDGYGTYAAGVNSSWTIDDTADIQRAGEDLYKVIYGEQDKEADGTPKVDADGKPVMKSTGLTGKLQELQDDLTAKKDALKALRADPSATAQQIKDAEDEVTAASKLVSDQQSEVTKAKEVYSFYDAYNQNLSRKTANEEKIAYNDARFDYDDTTKVYQEKDSSGNPVPIGTGVLFDEVAAEFDKRVAAAQKVYNDVRNPDGSLKTNSSMMAAAEKMATKVSGEDAKIVYDGVEYEHYDDNFTINGMTITALQETDKNVNVTTKNDTEGVYDMIKDFIKSYSELINEMDSLYNAESSKGYDPLLSEEKDALTDTEIEEWEKKIKDSLLRRDSTLSNVASALKMDMMKGFSIGGQMIYLSDFGINTLGYFNSVDNERNAYHIDGDPDDAKTKNNTDMLTSLIDNNPEAVMEFFTNLTNTLHDTLADKMSATTMSSALTVYNDKRMKSEYDDYTKKIKEQEEKLNSYIDKWYAKFSAMETALAKLESKNNSLSSLFGG